MSNLIDPRPADWDWVKATHECNASMMFGVLQTLAKRDVDRRNAQLDRELFRVQLDGGQFDVMEMGGGPSRAVRCGLAGDAGECIVVRNMMKEKVTYTVGLDAFGVCKLRRDGEELDPWQVLKAALEPLLFG